MKYVAPLSALVIACALLGLQVVGGLEHTEGGSLYTRASMIAAMMTLAVLPVFIEAARRSGHGWIALALGVSFVAFLAYSLPATTGRTGEIKETSAAAAGKVLEDKARIQADYDATKKLVDESNAWQPKACAGGRGKDCRSATFILNQRQASLEKLGKQLEAFQAPPPGDLGSDLWAWALSGLGVTAATVRKVSVLAFAIGLDFVIWSLVAFTTHSWPRSITETAPGTITDDEIKELKRVVGNDPLPPTKAIVPDPKGSNIIPWAKAFEREHSRKPRLDEALAAYPEVARTTCWRRLKAA